MTTGSKPFAITHSYLDTPGWLEWTKYEDNGVQTKVRVPTVEVLAAPALADALEALNVMAEEMWASLMNHVAIHEDALQEQAEIREAFPYTTIVQARAALKAAGRAG